MAEENLQFQLQQYYEVLMSINLKEKLKPFVRQFRKKNIPFIYETLVNTILIINDKHKNPLMKFNCLLATKLFFDTGQYIPIVIIQIYLLPIIFQIATYRIQKRSEQGVVLYFIERGYDQTKEMKRMGYNYVLLAIQFLFMSAQIKEFRTLENTELNQDSNYLKLCKVLKDRGLRQIQTYKFYIPSYINQTKKKYLKKLQKFRPQEYTDFFMKLICDEMNLNKKAQIDLKKILFFGDAYISIPLLHICEDELMKMDNNFENKKKYLNLIGDFMKLGDIYAVLILTRSNFLESIYDNIKDIKGEISISAGQSIYPQVEASKADKKEFYIQFLKNIEIWAHCHPIDEEGQPTDAKKIYEILKNERKFIFPSNILITKIRGQIEANLKLNQKRNQKLIKIVDEQNQNSIDSKRKSDQSKMSKKSKSALSAVNSFIEFQELEEIVLKTKKKLQNATQRGKVQETIHYLQKFKLFWQKNVEKNEIQADQSADIELIMQEGDLCLNVIQMVLPIYNLYKTKKITFEQYKDRVDLMLKKQAEESIKQTSFQYNLPIEVSKHDSYQHFQEPQSKISYQESQKLQAEIRMSINTIKEVSQGSDKPQLNYLSNNNSNKQYPQQKKAQVIKFSSLKDSESSQVKINESFSQLHEESSNKHRLGSKLQSQGSIQPANKSSILSENQKKSEDDRYNDKFQKQKMNASEQEYFNDSIASKKSSNLSIANKKSSKLSNSSSRKVLSRRNESQVNKDESIRDNSSIRKSRQLNRNSSIRSSRSRQSRLKKQSSYGSSQNVIQFQETEQKSVNLNYKNLFNKAPQEQYFPEAKESFISQYEIIPSFHQKNKQSNFDKQKAQKVAQFNEEQNVYIKKSKKKGVVSKNENQYDFFMNKDQKNKKMMNKQKNSKVSDENFANTNSLTSNSFASFYQTGKIPQIKDTHENKAVIETVLKKKSKIQVMKFQELKKCEAFKQYQEDSIIKQPELSPFLHSFHEENSFSMQSSSKISSFKGCVQINNEIIISKQNDQKLLRFNRKGKISNFIEIVYPKQIYRSKSITLFQVLSQRNAKNLIQNYRNQRQKSRATENLSERARSIESFNKNLRIKNVLNNKTNKNQPTNFLRINKTNGSQPVSFYNQSQSSRQKSQTLMKFDAPSVTESDKTLNYSRLINNKIYTHYFPQKDYDKAKKCMIKTKSLLVKSEQFEIGCVTHRSDVSINITLFITTMKFPIDDISFSVIHDQSLKVQLFTEYIEEIRINQQENINMNIHIENVPYVIPILKMKYRNVHTNQYNQNFITLPASFNKFFIFNQLTQDYYLQIARRTTDADYICTDEFKYNKKHISDEKIKEYFKNMTLIKRQNKTSQYANEIVYKGKIYIIKLTISDRGYMQFYGLNMTGDPKNIKFLEFLLITYRQIFELKKKQKVK